MELSKKQTKHLKQLAGVAYERELAHHLNELRNQFDEWKSGRIDVWQLTDLIHTFHDKESRDLYKFYVMGKNPGFKVAYAVRSKLISMNEIEESCREEIQYLIDSFGEK